MMFTEAKMKHYETVGKMLGCTDSTWSMYGVEDMAAEHPYSNVTKVVYKDHWGKNPVNAPVLGNSWVALFVAANECIRLSGDVHHRYIEAFEQDGDQLILFTGS